MEKEEKDIRFVARFYQEGRLNTTQAWEKLNIGKTRNKYMLWYRLTAIAAAVCLIAGFSWWWNYDRKDWVTITSSAQKAKEITLPDNTHITLAESSVLRYDRLAYGKTDRKVTLEGKAFFAVTHQEECPFKVETKLANVQVLGTRFQVKTDKISTSATVESGKVRFYNQAEQEAILTQGMHASINKAGEMKVETESNTNAFAWKTHQLIYNETRLKEVIKELEEVYNVHISGVPQQEHYLTAFFDQTPIEEIIDIINQTLDTKLDITK